MTTKKSAEESDELLPTAVDSVISWSKKCRIKLNRQKLVHVVFTINLYIDNIKFAYSNTAKYLGMTLDTNLK